jgi:hypothetical protein
MPSSYSEGEKNLMKSILKDGLMCNFRNDEILSFICQRMKRDVSEKYYYTLKKEVMAEVESPDIWLDSFVRKSLSSHYRDRIEEVKFVQRSLLIVFQREFAKEDKANKYLLNQLGKTIADNSKTLAEFGMAPPIIAKIKGMIPLDINDLQKRLETQAHKANETLKEYEGYNEASKNVLNNYDKPKSSQLSETEPIYGSEAESAIFPPIDKTVDDDGGAPSEATEQDDNRVF